MLSKNKTKFIKSLQIKKFRVENKVFLVEGVKSILELINSDFKIHDVYLTSKSLLDPICKQKFQPIPYELIDDASLRQISAFTTNDSGIAVVEMKPSKILFINKEEWIIVLDNIRDPGNLGTIVRIADWYGISKIICSPTSVDYYNPKVISASMGSFCRVEAYYQELSPFLKETSLPVFGADMEGESIHRFSFPKGGILLMGNESEGLSKDLNSYLTSKITIPRFGKAESLNVGVATAIICDSIARQKTS